MDDRGQKTDLNVSMDTGDVIETRMKQAQLLIEMNRSRDAVSILLDALRLEPENSDLLAMLSRAYSLHEDIENALLYASQAIAADPMEGEAYIGKVRKIVECR